MRSNTDNGIQIKIAEKQDDLTQGLSFISKCYSDEFSMHPAPPNHLIIALADSKVVGTIGLNTIEGGSLRLHKIYNFDWKKIPFPISLQNSVEFCRWISPSRHVSSLLIYHAILLSLQLKKKYVLCEHSRGVNRAARMFGISFHPISEAYIIPEEIEEIYVNYYKKIEAGLYLFNLDQAKNALESYTLR